MLASWALTYIRGVFYGWWIVWVGLINMTLVMGLFFHGFGFYFEPMRQQFGWSRTVLSGAWALSRFEAGFMGPVEGYLIQRFGPRVVMTAGFVILALGFALLSQVNSLPVFYLAFLVLSLGSGLASFSAIIASINNWFRRNRGKAFGIALLGTGLGGVVFAPIVAASVSNLGWERTALGSALIILLVGLPTSRLVRYSPEPYGYLPDGYPPTPKDPSPSSRPRQQRASPQGYQADYDFTVKEALRTPAFWLISVGHGLALLVISALSLHQVPYLETDLDFSRTSAAQVVMVLAGFAMLGQLMGGFLGNRYPKEYIATGSLLGHCGALLLLATADGLLQVMLASVIQGLAWGIRGPVLTSLRSDYFGRKSFAMIMGFSQVVIMVGMVVGPLLVGYLADNYNYTRGFIVIASLTGVGSLLFLFLRKPQRNSLIQQ